MAIRRVESELGKWNGVSLFEDATVSSRELCQQLRKRKANNIHGRNVFPRSRRKWNLLMTQYRRFIQMENVPGLKFTHTKRVTNTSIVRNGIIFQLRVSIEYRDSRLF